MGKVEIGTYNLLQIHGPDCSVAVPFYLLNAFLIVSILFMTVFIGLAVWDSVKGK